MADTYAFALGGALLLALFLSPVLCELLLSKVKPRPDNWLVRTLQTAYLRQLRRCLRHRLLTLGVFVLVVAGTAAVVPMLGREFLPELEEGNIWIAGTFPLKTSLDEVCEGVKIVRKIVQRYPECEQMISEVGRPDDGTDPSGFYGTESYVPLKPHEQWPIPPGQTRPRTKDELVEALNREISQTLVSVDWNFSQNIRNNAQTPGGGQQEHGGQQPVERTGEYARQRPHQTALRPPAPAPRAAADRFEFQRPHERPQPHPRRRLGDLVTPLGADGRPDEHGSFLRCGASDIYREQGERLIVVKFDIHNRDLAGAVTEAKQATKDLVHTPCRLTWGGEFREMEQAESRMGIVIPLAVALVAVLLYMMFGSLVDVLIVLSNVVALACGGVWALLLTQTNFSISAAVGFISIFGVAVMDAILQVSSFHPRRDRKANLSRRRSSTARCSACGPS